MNKLKRAFLVDVDNTLIDTEKLKETIEDNFLKKFGHLGQSQILWQVYHQVSKTSGFANIPEVVARLEQRLNLKNPKKLANIFYNAPFKKHLFPGALSTIKKLKKLGKVIIYSLGDETYQTLKIQKSGIEKIVEKENVIIVRDKKKGLKKLRNQLKKSGYLNIAIIDDKAEILEEATKINPEITTVWLRQGKYKDIHPKKTNSITFETDSLEKISDYFQSLVGTISSQRQTLKISVRRGISDSKVRQLIEYTQKDKVVKKYTHDPERFRNEKTYQVWAKTEKVLYTLSDREDNLLGLIWFRPKKLPQLKKYPFTFAIRTYAEARGKGLAKKFMKLAFEDFLKSKTSKRFKNKGIWLKTFADNFPAFKLYKHFGFKQVAKKDGDGQILMIYEPKLDLSDRGAKAG